ncbi:MAG: fimbria/pilus outer membrane usher protein [Candidatus Electrothrix communis]|nr:MAG: fimbria/pilus outer membrane usher protein [Candidatus Electrothrix communis]
MPSRAADEQPGGGPAILEIIVNGYNEGQQFVRVTQDGDVLLSPQLLEDLRFQPELWVGQSQNHISLSSLIPKIQFTLDQNSALLNVAVPAKWFKPQLVRDEKKYAVPEAPAEGVLSPRPWAGFLNYTLQVNFSEQEGGLSGVSLPWELSFNYKQWFVQSSFSSQYDPEEQTAELLRQNTSLLWDDPESMHSLTLGDFSSPYSMMGGGGSLTGISWRKNYSLDRTFHYDAELNLTIDIDSPVHAQLYSNGREVQDKEWDLLPGVVTFEDVAAYVSGDAELVLTDAFGRERWLKVPSFTGQNILKKGVHEYAYSLGWQQVSLGNENNEYSDPAAMGYHLYGFAETWTGGGVFAVTEDSFATGSTLAVLLGGFSQLETGFLITRNEEENFGYTGTARYSFRHKKINGYLGLSGFSREYSPVPKNGAADSEEKNESSETTPRYQGSLSISYSDMDWGGLSLGYAENGRWDGESSRSLSLTYRKSLFKGLHLTLGIKHDFEEEDNDSICLTLQYRPDKGSDNENWYDGLNAETRYHQVDGWENTAGLGRSYSEDTGYGYSANMSRKEDKVSATLRGQHKNAHGIYTAAAHYAEEGTSTGSLSAAGSLVLLDRGMYHSQPITDSFAVVRVKGLDEVTVKSNGRAIGKAGNDNSLLVPSLSSYSNNRLSIDVLNLPLNYNAAVMEQEVEVQQRSGSLVEFLITRFSAVEGELFLQEVDKDKEGEKKYVEEALPLELTFNGEKHEGFTGGGGYFYLENVPVGAHTLRLYQPGGYCLAKFTVPDTEKIVVNLGELSCVKEQDSGSGK